MSIVRREPFRDLVSLREAMDRLLEESFVRPRMSLFGGGVPTVPIDVYDSNDSIVVEALVPGAKPEDIDISIVGNDLTIRGETKAEREIKEENYFTQERRYGTFSRTIVLPVAVNSDQATASFENGVLKLILPKAEAAKPKQIKVKNVETK